KQNPVGTGAFKFVHYDESQQVVDLTSNEAYWGGAPAIKQLRVRTILDANTLQAELKSGGVDLAVVANLQPDTYQALGQDANLKVAQFPGVNVTYLSFNVTTEPLNDARVRQAIAYAIDRQAIVKELLLGQARVANSILPEQSWAYSPGQVYNFDPEKAKQILDEAGYKAVQ
ncbi:MAG: peptide/nickel transport system substrate-binding protein, partial [Acidobacteriota bacterium]|nr:peptide/nickel transport system substrate-binding protein [Acidobacteriota bacterium]